jgi:hypothetical protein
MGATAFFVCFFPLPGVLVGVSDKQGKINPALFSLPPGACKFNEPLVPCVHMVQLRQQNLWK